MSEEPIAPESPAPEVSVVVLSWNSAQFLPGCLQSLSRTRGVTIEVIHVDNASADRSHAIAESHPLVAMAIRLETNTGFGGGNNVGWAAARAPIVVFLNPDCYVRYDSIAELVRPLSDTRDVAITGAKLLYPGTNTIQHAGGILHPNAMAEHPGVNQPDGPEWSTPRDVDYVTGALMAIRKEDIESLGGFDSDYFPAYYEETDWCWRVRAAGRRVLYVPTAMAWHHESASLGKLSQRLISMSYRNRVRFVIKNYSVAEILTRWLPFELEWFRRPTSRGFRMAAAHSWASGALFALKCLVRFSRRPRA